MYKKCEYFLLIDINYYYYYYYYIDQVMSDTNPSFR